MITQSGDSTMRQSDRNKALVRDGYARWHETKGASVDHWMSLVDDDIAFGSLARGQPRLEFTAALRGKATLKGYFDGLIGQWTMIHYTIDNLIAEGDRVVAVGSTAWTNKATGKTVDMPKVDVWRFKDGKAIEFYEYYDTAAIIAAATP